MSITYKMGGNGASPTKFALKVEDTDGLSNVPHIGQVVLVPANSGRIVKCRIETGLLTTKSGKTSWIHDGATCYFVGYTDVDREAGLVGQPKAAPVKVPKAAKAAKAQPAAAPTNELATLMATIAALAAKVESLTANETVPVVSNETIRKNSTRRNKAITPADMTAVAAKLPVATGNGKARKVPCDHCGAQGERLYTEHRVSDAMGQKVRLCNTCLDIPHEDVVNARIVNANQAPVR